uniref:Secreted protein n=1 Tax=Anopheles darlingi TaxID=43151 RepID=A0A2M4DGK0_ANODA
MRKMMLIVAAAATTTTTSTTTNTITAIITAIVRRGFAKSSDIGRAAGPGRRATIAAPTSSELFLQFLQLPLLLLVIVSYQLGNRFFALLLLGFHR